jgi:mono/diheme cytochrome c family protein
MHSKSTLRRARSAAFMAFVIPAVCANPEAKVDFVREIQPILQQRCGGCHGEKQHLANLRLDLRDSARRVINAGHAEDSKLIQMITGANGKVMPPVGANLTDAQIALLTRWVNQGAPWPSSADARKHWAWEPIQHPTPPSVKRSDWPANDIDRFVLARLEKENITPSPEADRRTLLRRVSLDITGLPPTPQETAEFLADQRPDAYTRQVDRLLQSQHYGEKWARSWLDLAHYADSDGFEKDLIREWAWRYRDWVIEAYNRDLRYDRFVTLQIAGDELPDATVEDRIATGFYRNAMTNREAGVDRREARFDQLIDRVGTTGTVFLGITVRCAQCHDHKYDPIKQRDFYRLLAYFNASDEIDIDAPLPGEMGPYLRVRPEYETKRAELMKQYKIPELQKQWETDMLENMDHPGRFPEWDFQVTEIRAGLDHAERVLRTKPETRSEFDARRLTARFLRLPGPRYGADKDLTAKLKEAKEKLDELDKTFPSLSKAYAMEDRPEYGPAHIAVRGDWKNPGEEVEPGVPAFLPNSGPARRRLDLARWIVAPENPLTARVAVDRIWQEFFGRGIVSTTDDFGTQGGRPSHPELLDWLATRYRQLEWSNKALIREIVLSRTYRQSSSSRPDLEQKDPENTLLARQSRVRLPAELIRDAALEVSGLLDTDVGGPPIKPFQPVGVAELGYSVKKWVESPGRTRYRRGLYIHYQRTTPYPFLVNFDEPDSTLSCTRRRLSNTALQALDLLNDPVFFEAATAFANRIETEAKGDFKSHLDYAFRIALDREPTEKETARLASYFDLQASLQQKDPAAMAPWVGVSRILLNLDEFITRE